MKKPPSYWYKAKKILSRRDPVVRKIIKKYKKGYLATKNNPFFSLCRTIVGQQVSVASADSIWFKFSKKCRKLILTHATLCKTNTLNLNLKSVWAETFKNTMFLKISILTFVYGILHFWILRGSPSLLSPSGGCMVFF